MEIELAKADRMSQSGSSLLRLIQNVNMPILDLLVRESIQNSLDAAKEEGEFVLVEFLTGLFFPMSLYGQLNQISNQFIKKFRAQAQEYIAIRDFNTHGLTGPLNYEEVENGDYGNLLKLVYEISKPQEKEGAGGSWGLGKTVYFRVGIGLVFYYSRIFVNGSYQSRLAATLVENEKSPDSLLYEKGAKVPRGIAWWGKKTKTDSNQVISKEEEKYIKTEPITDENEINKVLSIFNIPPYIGEETGTTIIIPFIDSKRLLLNNFKEEDEENPLIEKPYWMSNLADYLEVAIQRWYAPRLDNPYYPYGKFLKAKVNHEEIKKSKMDPAFLLIQNLYNKANGKPIYRMDEPEHIQIEDISLHNEMKKALSGRLAFVLADRKLLRMDPPDNLLPPNIYFGCIMENEEDNRPVIGFVRRPGMIVAYEESGKWIDKIPNTESDQYLIALFVLNSENYLKKIPEMTLEEYVRKSEGADHTNWSDYTVKQGVTPRIVSKTQKNISSKLTNIIKPKKREESGQADSSLGKYFGEILLPPEDFGKRPSGTTNKQKESTKKNKEKVEVHKNLSLRFFPDFTEYSPHSMTLYFELTGKKDFDKCHFELCIDSETGTIKPKDWEDNLGLELPFELEEVKLDVFDSKKKTKHLGQIKVDASFESSKEGLLEMKLKKTRKGQFWEVEIQSQEKIPFFAKGSFRIHLSSRNFRPTIQVIEEH